MGLGTYAKSKIKKMGLMDIQMIKLSSAAFVLMITKLWKPLLSLDRYWYALIFVLAAIIPMCKALGK